MNKFLKYLLIAFISLIHQTSLAYSEIEKIKIGLLVPMTGKDKNLGQQLIKATRMALNDIGSENLEIYPRDTESDPNKTMRSAIELKEMGINIILGPVFYKSLINLNKIEDVIFVSFTNKTVNISGNIISAGINATSQLNTIKKFIDLNEIKKTIFLTPKVDYEKEIKDSIK